MKVSSSKVATTAGIMCLVVAVLFPVSSQAFPITINAGESFGLNFTAPVAAPNVIGFSNGFSGDAIFTTYDDLNLAGPVVELLGTSSLFDTGLSAYDDGAFSMLITAVSPSFTLFSFNADWRNDALPQNFLDVSATVFEVVPAPATLALFGIGLLGIRLRRST
ncbi:MAG: PEP-CTERM sorting domain-containing protein [Pseudomonadota bacterium]